MFKSLAVLATFVVGSLAGEAVHLVNCQGPHGQASYVVVRHFFSRASILKLIMIIPSSIVRMTATATSSQTVTTAVP